MFFLNWTPTHYSPEEFTTSHLPFFTSTKPRFQDLAPTDLSFLHLIYFSVTTIFFVFAASHHLSPSPITSIRFSLMGTTYSPWFFLPLTPRLTEHGLLCAESRLSLTSETNSAQHFHTPAPSTLHLCSNIDFASSHLTLHHV